MRPLTVLPVLALVLAPDLVAADPSPVWETPGSLLRVVVEVEGRQAPLYPAPDGSGRYYVEARRGASYSLRLANRSRERIGVVVRVDGLNVISGERGDGGRMYVLDPWGSSVIQGWRTSLQDVRRFAFVDEERSYATRSGKANSRMGWIEIEVFRERGRWARRQARDRIAQSPGADETPRPSPPSREIESLDEPAAAGKSMPSRDAAAREGRRYPGTGWGEQTRDPVVVVDFQPEGRACESIALRYEYASGLRALGVWPAPRWGRDRLRERDDGGGFAKPPAWD